jgi:hypothetical protein
MQNVPTLLTILMAIAMRRYYTMSITRPMEEVRGFRKSH